jgi:hypothetical protein
MHDHVTRRVVVQFVFIKPRKVKPSSRPVSRYPPGISYTPRDRTADFKYLETRYIMVAAGSITVAGAYLALC